MARGVYFYSLLEVVPGTDGNAFANQIMFRADRPNGLWFAGDGASAATWRSGHWFITQQPDTIRTCFAWCDGVRVKERIYLRHPVFDFYWSAIGGSAAHVKILLQLSSDGRWNRLLPTPLHQTVLE